MAFKLKIISGGANAEKETNEFLEKVENGHIIAVEDGDIYVTYTGPTPVVEKKSSKKEAAPVGEDNK